MSNARLLDFWSPPDGAGAAQACLATTFTFDAEFFAEDCLSRFLSLSSVRSEAGDQASIATVLEEEERLSETQVSVLVDRSCDSQKRNLRWDVLTVRAPGGLLHSKVAVLLWERAARVVLGSANLTAAGYRRQVEIALSFDLHEGCDVPRDVLDDLDRELRRLVALAPGPDEGPKARALGTLTRLAERVASLDLPRTSKSSLRLALAPGRPGSSPLERMGSVWRGPQPLRATVLSPFWDDDAAGRAVDAVARLLKGRGAEREVTLVVDQDPVTGVVRAPATLAARHRVPSAVAGFAPPEDKEVRLLHGKCVLVESDDWLAAMVGSSNATVAGFGLHPHYGHQELNLWIGCAARGQTAKQLRSLVASGDALDLEEQELASPLDEDDIVGPVLPVGFDACLIDPGPPARALLTFAPRHLPPRWSIHDPAGNPLLEHDHWREAGQALEVTVHLVSTELPAYLVVHWEEGAAVTASWTANVFDRALLPPPAELKDLPVAVLLAALASTRPLPVALEAELRKLDRTSAASGHDPLDPLKRFNDTGTLLHRARRVSLSLHGLKERLARPATSLDTVEWRLRGVVGPIAIADGLVASASDHGLLPGEAHFLLAELVLTISTVDWDGVVARSDRAALNALVREVIDELEQRLDLLGEAGIEALMEYSRDAFKKARS